METTIEVSIDKSHLATIGEKLYGESLELIRELVSNAYDADATKVWVDVRTNTIAETDSYRAFEIQSELLSDCF